MTWKRTFKKSKNRKSFSLRKKYREKRIKKRKSKKKKIKNQYGGVKPPARFTRNQRRATPEEMKTLNIDTLISEGDGSLKNKTGKFIILNKNPSELRFIDSTMLFGEDNLLGHVSMLDTDDFTAYYKFDNLRTPEEAEAEVDPNDTVMMAGWIKFDRDGKIEKWNAHSGHYHPEDKDIEYTITETEMPRDKKKPDHAPILF
jgi:hypothetical protein